MLEWAGLAAGLLALYLGAEWLVRGAARLAYSLGVRPLVIGLTVVGFGTSMPEVVVSATASAAGQPALALGNVLGSNVANSGLILALAALIRPVQVDLALLRRESPLMLALSAAVYALAWLGAFPRWLGGAMLAGLVMFVYASLRWARAEPAAVEAEFREFGREQHLFERSHRLRQAAWIVVGLAVLILGGKLLVDSAVILARRFGVAESVIGATLVAVGTSLPELATSVVAALRKHGDISVGNIIGSNIFNLLGVLGVAVAIRAVPVAAAVRDFEFPWMVGFAGATVLVLRSGRQVTRLEGALLLAGYAVFVALLLR